MFPDLPKSKPFKSGYSWDKNDYYVVIVNDFEKIVSSFYDVDHSGFWIWQIVDSQVTLKQEFEEDDDEITLDDCKRLGAFVAIEQFLGLTKEINIAYAFYKLAEKEGITPLQFADAIASQKQTPGSPPVLLAPLIFGQVMAERERQFAKWGDQRHKPIEWIAILTEEVGEASKEALDFHFKNEDGGSLERYRDELIQVTAVAFQMLQDLYRSNPELKNKQ